MIEQPQYILEVIKIDKVAGNWINQRKMKKKEFRIVVREKNILVDSANGQIKFGS
jgi:hypothetical protein